MVARATTLTEALLLCSGAVNRAGRVDSLRRGPMVESTRRLPAGPTGKIQAARRRAQAQGQGHGSATYGYKGRGLERAALGLRARRPLTTDKEN